MCSVTRAARLPRRQNGAGGGKAAPSAPRAAFRLTNGRRFHPARGVPLDKRGSASAPRAAFRLTNGEKICLQCAYEHPRRTRRPYLAADRGTEPQDQTGAGDPLQHQAQPAQAVRRRRDLDPLPVRKIPHPPSTASSSAPSTSARPKPRRWRTSSPRAPRSAIPCPPKRSRRSPSAASRTGCRARQAARARPCRLRPARRRRAAGAGRHRDPRQRGDHAAHGDGAGVDGVLLCNRKARMTHPKLIKGSQGAVLSVPFFEFESVSACRGWLGAHGSPSTSPTRAPSATTSTSPSAERRRS